MNSQQRRLFLLVFLWTCLCLYLLRSHNAQINEPPPPSEPLPIFEYQLAPSSSPEHAELALEQLSSPIISPASSTSKSTKSISRSGEQQSQGYEYKANKQESDNYDNLQENSNHKQTSTSKNKSAATGQSSDISENNKNIATSDQINVNTNYTSQAENIIDNEEKLHHDHQDSPPSIDENDQDAERQQKREKLINSWREKMVKLQSDEEADNNANYSFPGAKCQYDYPSLLDLQFNNVYWQKMTSRQPSNSKPDLKREFPKTSPTPAYYYLYNAYYDDRWRAKGASVRILAMIDRNQPPNTNCLLWSRHLGNPAKKSASGNKMVPLVSQAKFVYAWYPKWGNHHDGMLQPWIVTCPIPDGFNEFVPDSVSLVQAPFETSVIKATGSDSRISKRSVAGDTSDDARAPLLINNNNDAASSSSSAAPGSIAMPPGSSSSPTLASGQASSSAAPPGAPKLALDGTMNNLLSDSVLYDCKQTVPITNNLPVFNIRPKKKQNFAVCVKGLDFPNEDLSVRLVEWIELLNLLGASKIFLYNLNVHENITRVLHYYKKRGLVELVSLTLPGDQPNLPEYQHAYLKNRLTTKRQNELIPYNDCLYRNLYSYKYLALLDIDEIIMPLKHHTWFGLMDEVERVSLLEQNYSRASYNTRNVYFFDDLMGPLGTTSSSTTAAAPAGAADTKPSSEGTSRSDTNHGEQGIPHYLHMMQHVYRSKNYTKPGQYVKCFHNTERVVSLHNHFPMNCFGQCTTYSIPTSLAHLQHYRRDCVGPLKQACKSDFRLFTTRDTTIWKYKQQMVRRATRVLHELELLEGGPHSKLRRAPDS